MKKAIKRILALGAGATMVGATIMGAMALTLADYPEPFVTDGLFSGEIVVGEKAATSDVLGAIDIAASLQAIAKTATAVEVSGSTVVVTDGDTDEVFLGDNVADATNGGLDATYTDEDMSILQDTTIDVNGTDINVHDEITITSTLNFNVSTSLTETDDKYEDNVALEIQKKSLKYCYVFDESTNLGGNVSSDVPLEISFLGMDLEVVNVVDTDTIQAIAGTKVFLNAGDTVEVDGKTIEFVMSSATQAVVVVDGEQDFVGTTSTKTINGLKVKVDALFNDDGTEYDSVSLIVGEDAQKTYNDGDAFIGQDEDDPDWIWDLADMAALGSSQTFCIENDFVFDDWQDGPAVVGEYYSFPNDFAQIGIESLTVSNYMPLFVEYDSTGDISDAVTDKSSEPVIKLYVTGGEDEGLQVNATSGWVGTDIIYLWWNETINITGVFYEDSNNDVTLARNVDMSSNADIQLARINYRDTTGADMPIDLQGNFSVADGLSIVFDSSLTLNGVASSDDITVNLSHGLSGDFTGLGATANDYDAGDLLYGTSAIGTKDENHRTVYGIVIDDPQGNAASDEVELSIPGDQVKANVVLKSTSSTTSSGATGTSYTVNPIAVGMAKLDSDVTLGLGGDNLIVIGGPNANTIAMQLMGNPENPLEFFEEGKAHITLYEDYNAILVAGYEAEETLGACYVLASYDDYTLTGTQVEVVVTSLDNIAVNPVSS